MKYKPWRLFCVVAALSLVAAGCGDDTSDPGADTTTTEADASTQDTALAPTLEIDLTPDAVGGQNLHLRVANYDLSPQEPAYLLVDGEEVLRIYSDWVHMSLDPGDHEVRVLLAARDVEASTTISVPESDATHMHHDGIEVEGTVPEPSISVTESFSGGWDVHAQVANFVLAPENASGPHVLGEGHLHLYVDGVKVRRLYHEWWHLAELSPGEHEITIEVNGNNHAPYTVGGETISASAIVTVEGDAADPVADVVVDVRFVGGEVEVSDNRIEVKLGQLVQLNVTSDVDDEVHVHGYDFTVNAVENQTVSLGFEANVPGVFEVEFENSGVLIVELEVS